VLQTRDISAERWRDTLDTKGLRDQQDLSADIARQWWRMKLDDGRIYTNSDRWPTWVPTESFYDAFVEEMSRQRSGALPTRLQFTKQVKSYLPSDAYITVRTVDVNVATFGAPVMQKLQRRVLMLPPLDRCRAFFDEMTGTRHAWEQLTHVDPRLLELANEVDDDDI
jgi:hypothetical protein